MLSWSPTVYSCRRSVCGTEHGSVPHRSPLTQDCQPHSKPYYFSDICIKKVALEVAAWSRPVCFSDSNCFFFIFNFLFHHKAMEIRFLTELINNFFFSKERKPAIVDVCASNSFIEIKRWGSEFLTMACSNHCWQIVILKFLTFRSGVAERRRRFHQSVKPFLCSGGFSLRLQLLCVCECHRTKCVSLWLTGSVTNVLDMTT